MEQPHFTNEYEISLFKLDIRILKKKCGKEEKLGAISPLFHNILLPIVRFRCYNRDQINTEIRVIRDKRSRDKESRLYMMV